MAYENRGTIPPRYIVSSFGDGNYNVDGTADEVQINQAINDLTSGRDWQEGIRLKGDFTLAGPIVVPSWTDIGGPAKLALANATNLNMIENANPAANNIMVSIHDLQLDGNNANQGSSGVRGTNGIYWRNATQPANATPWIKFWNLDVSDCYDDSVHIDLTGGSQTFTWMDSIYTRFSFDYGFDLTAIAEGWISNCHGAGDDGSNFTTLGPVQFSGFYNNQQTIFTTCENTLLESVFIDHGTAGQNGLEVLGCQHMIFDNVQIRRAGTAAFSDTAVVLDTGGGQETTDCTFTNFHIGDRNGTRGWTNGVTGDVDQDRNIFKDWTFITSGLTNLADLAGVNNKFGVVSAPFVLNRGGATEADHGIDVSSAGEHAVANVFLPYNVNQLIWVTVDAYIGAAPGVGDTMEIELRVNGGSDNQPWGTHTTTIANLQSVGTNYLVGDVGTWRRHANDSAGILALTGGDSVQVDVYHEVGSGEEASTNAEFRSVSLWYI